MRTIQGIARIAVAAFASIALVAATSAGAQTEVPASAPASYAATDIVGKTRIEKAIGKCVGAVIGGALLGALVGAAAKDTGRGAALGAAVGAGACVVLMSVAAKKDKQQLRALQLAALNSRTAQTGQWTTDKGESATAYVTSSNIVQVSASKSATPLQCTHTNLAMTVANGAPSNYDDVFCLQGDKWVAADKLKDLGVNTADIVA